MPDDGRPPSSCTSRSRTSRSQPSRLGRPRYRAGLLDIAADLRDELGLRRKGPLLTQVRPQLEHEPLAVEVAVEVEEVRLDPPLGAAVVRVHADGDGGAVAAREARVDPVRRHDEVRPERKVRGRVAERAAALVAGDDRPVELVRTAEEARRLCELSRAHGVADRCGRHACHGAGAADVVAEAPQERQIAGARAAEAEVVPGDDDLAAHRLEDARDELLRLELAQLEVEADDERVLDAQLREQLELPLLRRQELDAVAERDARVRVEGEDRRDEPGCEERIDDGDVAAMDTVEGADRHRARQRLERARAVRDVHGITVSGRSISPSPAAIASRRPAWRRRTRPSSAPTTARPLRTAAASASSSSRSGRNGSTSGGGTIRPGSASSTANGPTVVRRSSTQWPPSASAIARTYVPEET